MRKQSKIIFYAGILHQICKFCGIFPPAAHEYQNDTAMPPAICLKDKIPAAVNPAIGKKSRHRARKTPDKTTAPPEYIRLCPDAAHCTGGAEDNKPAYPPCPNKRTAEQHRVDSASPAWFQRNSFPKKPLFSARSSA